MATYTVTGHPLNYADLALAQADLDAIRAGLVNNGVGATFTATLSGGGDTKVKGHGVLR